MTFHRVEYWICARCNMQHHALPERCNACNDGIGIDFRIPIEYFNQKQYDELPDDHPAKFASAE